MMQENATSGEHLWVDTSISGDFCYVGESECTVYIYRNRLIILARSARMLAERAIFSACVNFFIFHLLMVGFVATEYQKT